MSFEHAPGYRIVTYGDLLALRQELEEKLLPIAVGLGLSKVGSDPQTILDACMDSLAEQSYPKSSCTPEERVSIYLALVVGTLYNAISFSRRRLEDDCRKSGEWAFRFTTELRAYLVAVQDVRRARSAPATAGRKMKGEKTRQKIEQAANPLKGKISKEQAAVQISEQLSLSPATVRKILMEIFPGATWKDLDK